MGLVPAERATNSVEQEDPKKARDTSFVRMGRPVPYTKLYKNPSELFKVSHRLTRSCWDV